MWLHEWQIHARRLTETGNNLPQNYRSFSHISVCIFDIALGLHYNNMKKVLQNKPLGVLFWRKSQKKINTFISVMKTYHLSMGIHVKAISKTSLAIK